MQQAKARRHDYCLTTWPFDTAPHAETYWRKGLFLIGNEPHLENFHHANRDALFFSWALRHITHPMSGIIVAHNGDVVPWVLENLRALLPQTLISKLVWTARPPRRRLDGAATPSAVQPLKRGLSNASLLDGHLSSARWSSTRWSSSHKDSHGLPPRFVCLEAAAEKLTSWPTSRADLGAVRAAAYAHCGIPTSTAEAPSERLLLVLLRGNVSLGDSARTPRQVANTAELLHFARRYASTELGGALVHATAFAGQTYCDQVRLVARARMLIGLHGQGLTNGQFMREDGVLVEIFYRGYRQVRGMHFPWTHQDSSLTRDSCACSGRSAMSLASAKRAAHAALVSNGSATSRFMSEQAVRTWLHRLPRVTAR